MIEGEYLDQNKNPLQSGIYNHSGGGVFYLSLAEDGWIGESIRGIIFRVTPSQSSLFIPRNPKDLEGLTQDQIKFIKSKTE